MDVSLVLSEIILIYLSGLFKNSDAESSSCGCKSVRPCFEQLYQNLQYGDEVLCIEQAAIGSSTVEIYLRAVQTFCKDFITIREHSVTFEGRTLFAVVLEDGPGDKPTIMLDAGQEAGNDPVGLVLYFIQQLLACEEYSDMIAKVRWIILPSTNPDGMEYAMSMTSDWRKNMMSFDDKPGLGVDISRNFDNMFENCDERKEPSSATFPGTGPTTEIETKMITDMIDSNDKIDAYMSIRRDGHAILYPSAYDSADEDLESRQAAEQMSAKVNQRSGAVRVFTNGSIFSENNEKRCGHSVDYARKKGIKINLEMRVFHGAENEITMKFQNLPRGYRTTLLNGYFSALRELYTIVLSKANPTTPTPQRFGFLRK